MPYHFKLRSVILVDDDNYYNITIVNSECLLANSHITLYYIRLYIGMVVLTMKC